MFDIKRMSSDSKDMEKLDKLYHLSFPFEEQIDYKLLLDKHEQEKGSLSGIYDDDKLVGLMYYTVFDDGVHLFYFAIDPDSHSKGYGGRALDLFTDRFSDKKITLFIEPMDDESAENYEQRQRRLKFYENHNYRLTGEQLEEGGVIYDVMTNVKEGKLADDYYKVMDYFWAK